jgi:hypothetical protein
MARLPVESVTLDGEGSFSSKTDDRTSTPCAHGKLAGMRA